MNVGYEYSFWQDIFIVNAVVQLGVCYSRNAWYLYAVVPLYVVWKCWEMIKPFVGGGGRWLVFHRGVS